jgi:solute carrier family 25 (mitochondrial folate transporter), member 32
MAAANNDIQKRMLEPSEHFIAGTLAGLVSTAILFPLDTIKVRYQVDEKTTLRAPRRLISAFRSVVQQEGWQGMYQGLAAGLYGSGLSWGGYFFFYEHAKRRWLNGTDQTTNTTLHHFAASCEAGTIMVGLTNPIWLIKTRMQLQVRQIESLSQNSQFGMSQSRLQYKSFSDALVTIVREEGPLALYKGSIPALMLVSHGVVQFVVYERLKSEVANASNGIVSSLGSAHFLGLGAMSKIIASVTTYPLQVIKTRLQQRSTVTDERAPPVGKDNCSSASAAESRRPAKWSGGMLFVGTRAQYRGVVDCVVKTWTHEGAYGFFKGCLPNAIRVAPGAAVTFFTYETVASMLRLRS